MNCHVAAVVLSLAATCSCLTRNASGGGAARQLIEPYMTFCPMLSSALAEKDIRKLVELTEPAFQVALTNDVNKLKFRFDGIKGGRVYCSVGSRKALYSEDVNLAIDSLVGNDIVDLIPVCAVCLKDIGEVPFVDRLFVNTLLHKDGSVKIIGRFVLGPYSGARDVEEDFAALRNRQTGFRTDFIYRGVKYSISDNELAWRIARSVKDFLERNDVEALFSDRISENGDKQEILKTVKQLSSYRLREIVPYRSDGQQYNNNTVDARAGDQCAYSLVVFADENPAMEMGRICVVVGRDSQYRIISAVNIGGLLGILPAHVTERAEAN